MPKPAELVKNEIPAIVAKARQTALEGNTSAMRLFLAPPKPCHPFVVIDVPEGATLTQRGEAVLAAMMAGKLQPDVGDELMSAIARQARIMVDEQIIPRVADMADSQLAALLVERGYLKAAATMHPLENAQVDERTAP